MRHTHGRKANGASENRDIQAYPQVRMQQLLKTISATLLRYLTSRLSTVALWSDAFPQVRRQWEPVFV